MNTYNFTPTVNFVVMPLLRNVPKYEFPSKTDNINQIVYTIPTETEPLLEKSVMNRIMDYKKGCFYLTRDERISYPCFQIFLEEPEMEIDDYGSIYFKGKEDFLWNGIIIPREYIFGFNDSTKDPLYFNAKCMKVYKSLCDVLKKLNLEVKLKEKTINGITKFEATLVKRNNC